MVSYMRSIFIFVSCVSFAECSYRIRQVTEPLGNLESLNWSAEENVFYFVDSVGGRLLRMEENTCKITTRNIKCGVTSLIMPIKGSPGYVLVGVQSSLYIMQFDGPSVNENKALRLLTTVDLGKPDNYVTEGKVDAKGRLWFGTVNNVVGSTVVPDQGSIYVITNMTYAYPRLALRPTTLPVGIAWSKDNKKIFFNDAATRKVVAYDYNLEKGEIANKTILFDFDEFGIAGLPSGMTIDSEGNIWLATYSTKVLKINASSGKVLQEVNLPVDQTTCVAWGGQKLDTLYVTTASLDVDLPKPASRAIFAVLGLGSYGRPENYMEFENVENY